MKERMEQEITAIGYDPLERQALEHEYATLEGPWKETPGSH